MRSCLFDVTLVACVAGALAGCSSDRTGLPASPLAGDQLQGHPANGYRLVHAFAGGKDGSLPESDLVYVNGKLYGTTASGGDVSCFSGIGCGTVFEISPNGTHRVIHRFTGYPHDGADPQAGLIDVNGALYGTTAEGAASPSSNVGTVYRISTSGQEKAIYGFGVPNDGRYPTAELVYDHGLLFGTTQTGGYGGCYSGNTCGTVFGVTLSGKEDMLYRFRGAPKDGLWPDAGLALLDHRLYGTTTYGGARYGGTMFEISATGKERIRYSFVGGHYGAYPEAQLTGLHGELYGTTTSSGAYGLGAVFAISPSGKLRIIHEIQGFSPRWRVSGGSFDRGKWPALRYDTRRRCPCVLREWSGLRNGLHREPVRRGKGAV